ncbi:MAG: hypothetical protein ACHQ53_08555 [Polyangiales bacterium]
MRAPASRALFAFGLCAALCVACACDRLLPRRTGPVGVLSGRVRLAEGAALPEYAAVDLSRRPLLPDRLPQAPTACAAANERARRPVELGADRGLGGVIVAASDFTRFRQRDLVKHRVVIQGCRLSPAVIAAQGGDVLELENLDDFDFEPLLGPTFTPRALPRGRKVRVPLSPGGIESLICSPSAPCGRTDLVVFFHSVYAVTDARGDFRIPAFPAAEQVRVSAWHPLFDASETFVWLDPGERASADFSLSPKRRFVPAD